LYFVHLKKYHDYRNVPPAQYSSTGYFNFIVAEYL
jgi:hypothetical protein